MICMIDSTSSLARARCDFAAAEALFREGLVGQCHAFILAALYGSLAAWHADRNDALAALASANYPGIDRLRAIATTYTVPSSTANNHLPADFEAIWSEAERLFRFSKRKLVPAGMRRARRLRLGVIAALTLLLAVLVTERLWGRIRVRASGVLSTDFGAEFAIDGANVTEWLLPQSSPGWLELTLPRARHVHGVRVVNGHNRNYLDRGVERFRVTLIAGEKAIKTAEGHFEKIEDKYNTIDLAIDGEQVTLIRLEILSWFGSGGAVSEVEVK
jgi:hypothetical protein